eukprot:14259107-Alexandrium_andersonii.AAC.1
MGVGAGSRWTQGANCCHHSQVAYRTSKPAPAFEPMATRGRAPLFVLLCGACLAPCASALRA